MSRRINYFTGVVGCPDADVQAFLAATGITDATIVNALCTLVSNAKTNGWWTVCNAIYPFVGGTATTHKFNLKNPADTNAAFRLQFFGGWTHSANGALPNGTNAYADTFLNANTILNIASSHVSYYSRTNISENRYEIAAGVDPASYIGIVSRNTLNNFRIISFTGSFSDAANSDSRGWFCNNRVSATVLNSFKNSTKTHNVIVNAIGKPNKSIYLGAINFTTPSLFSRRECAFSTIGSGLTDALAALMYADIQTFQTALSRNV
jgi:hypothetical protein